MVLKQSWISNFVDHFSDIIIITAIQYNIGVILSPNQKFKADVWKHVVAFKMYGFLVARGEPDYR